MKRNKSGFTLVELIIVVGIIAVIGGIIMSGFGGMGCGYGSMGPTKTHDCVITRLYTDTSGSGGKHPTTESHYMVGTDKGVFEVDNGLFLGVWNADELYSKLIVGHRYNITTKGNKVVNMFLQEYPYIVAVQEITPAAAAAPTNPPPVSAYPPPVSGLEK